MLTLQKARGLTMFYLETKNDDGKLNGMEIIKLKNKLGKFVNCGVHHQYHLVGS